MPHSTKTASCSAGRRDSIIRYESLSSRFTAFPSGIRQATHRPAATFYRKPTGFAITRATEMTRACIASNSHGLKYGASAGWTSAMGQGEAISVLLRAETLEPSKGYGPAAERAGLPFLKDIADGGVVWRSGKDVFFEEIANEHASHVLNGCIFALWGLWELWKRTGDPKLEPIVSAGVDTLRRWLPQYDTGWWTRYSLLVSADGQPHIATLKYHQFHIAQMLVLARMFDESSFEEAAHRWTSYIDKAGSRARVIGAALRSVPERFLRRDTIAGGAHT